jgi:hypothetical protein
MRAFSLFTFATAILGGVSALTVPYKRSNFDSVDALDVREPANPIPNPIKFSGGAKAHLDRLGLAKGSAERKQVKAYHRKIIAEEMARNGAHSAQVVHLAHSVGSVDPKLHITAGFWDASNTRIKSTYGDPPKSGNLHHVYADHHPVDPVYAHHVAAAGGTLRRSLPSDLNELEAREPAKHAVPNAIKFSAGAKAHLDSLGLAKGSAERKAVKEYHRKIIAAEMAKNGAASARVSHLGHSTGSVDSKYHVTAGFWDKSDKRMKSTYGTGANIKTGDLHHVYADKGHVDPAYEAAVLKAGKTL